MIHLEGGCKVCRRIGPRWPDEEEDDDKWVIWEIFSLFWF
jgi:hypothetical protein